MPCPEPAWVRLWGLLAVLHPPPNTRVFVLLTFLDSKLLVRPQGSQPWWGQTEASLRLPSALWQSRRALGAVRGQPALPARQTRLVTCSVTYHWPQAEPAPQAPPPYPPNTGSPLLRELARRGDNPVSFPALREVWHTAGAQQAEGLSTSGINPASLCVPVISRSKASVSSSVKWD